MSQLSPRVADRGTEENMCRKTQKHVRHVCIWGCLSYPVELWSCIHRQDWPLCQWPRTCEHALSLRSTSGGYLLLHCVTCFCVPKFESITVLGRGADKTAREQLEVYEIEKEKVQCVSQTSLYLHKREMAFLSTCWCSDGLLIWLFSFVFTFYQTLSWSPALVLLIFFLGPCLFAHCYLFVTCSYCIPSYKIPARGA